MTWSSVSGAFTGQAARDVIDWCSVITLTAVRVGSAKIRLASPRILGSLLNGKLSESGGQSDAWIHSIDDQ
jgi:hypothetical protein